MCKDKCYELRVKAISLGSSVQTDISGISMCDITEVVLLLSAATSLNGFDKCPEKEGYAKGAQDPGLESLYFQFSHYLLISSSRPGVRQPACKAYGTISCRRPGAPNHQHQHPDELRPAWFASAGGFEVGIDRDNHKLMTMQVTSLQGGVCRLRSSSPVRIGVVKAAAGKTTHGYVLTFPTHAWKTYKVKVL